MVVWTVARLLAPEQNWQRPRTSFSLECKYLQSIRLLLVHNVGHSCFGFLFLNLLKSAGVETVF